MEKFLSLQQQKVLLENAPANLDRSKIIKSWIDSGVKLEGFETQEVKKNTAGKQVKEAFKAGVEQVKSGYQQSMSSFEPGKKTLPALGQFAEGALESASGIASTVTSPLAPVLEPVSKGVNFLADKIGESKSVQDFSTSKAGKVTSTVAKNVANLANVAGTIEGVRGTPKVIKSSVNKLDNFVVDMTKKTEGNIQSKVLENYNKGIKPSLAGKNTTGAVETYKKNVITAVDTIKQNRQNLSFVDDLGETITGSTPKTLQQLVDSIEQTKKSIFTNYDNLAKQAGEAGVAVDMKPIASELDTVINNQALAITNPKAIEYANTIKDRLIKADRLDATTAQEVIQNYNKSLEAFYRNPSYDNASQVAIDALLANKIRDSLDSGITGLTGEQYGALKKQYGALKSIEKDVVKASLRDAKKGAKGLIDFTDIFSGGQVVNGILSLNPAQVASGLTQKAISEFYKYLNNPNRAIEKMFKD
jgi:5'(3')-deoxyribonucleotidase